MAELRIPPGAKNDNKEKFSLEATHMEELVQQLCDSDQNYQPRIESGLLPPPPQPPIFPMAPIFPIGGFDPMLGFRPGGNAGIRGTGVAHSVYASDQRGYRVDLGPRNRAPFVKPSVAAAQGGRVRVYQEQNQNWNPVFPGRVMMNGTGVFLPRLQPPAMQGRKNAGVNKVLTDFKHEESQNRMPVAVKKTGKKNKKKASAAKGVNKDTSTEVELGLPQEWTY